MSRAVVLLVLLGVLVASEARAERVPAVSSKDLPVGGLGAPIPSTGVTWITVGELGWYRIDQDPREVDQDGLVATLAERAQAAKAAGRPIDVWMLVSGERSWAHVVKVVSACQHVGIHRVGLQVRAESGEGLAGFPLFLPYGEAPAATPGTQAQARRLDVNVTTGAEHPSDPAALYAAAQRAVQRFGPVVAEVRMSVDARVQYAVKVIDMLHRAGCSAVKLRYGLVQGLINPQPQNAGPAKITILETRDLLPGPLGIEVPPVAVRKTPWPDDGAAQPGAFAWVLEDIAEPGRDEEGTEEGGSLPPLPSFAARGGEVPSDVLRTAQGAVAAWADNLGRAFAGVLQRGGTPSFPGLLLVQRKRQELEAARLFKTPREVFPEPERVSPATLRVEAYLARGDDLVGKVDLTLSLSLRGLTVLDGRWVAEDYPKDLVLPPVEADPFAAGVPGHLRVFLEGLLAALRARGPGGLPLAAEPEVLAELPPVAHAGARARLQGRDALLTNLSQWLRATPYDRIFLLAPEGTASVRARGRVIGILRYVAEPEQAHLRLSAVEARAVGR